MANIALFAAGGSAVYYVLNATPIDNTGATHISGTIREQDLTPTFKQSVEGVGSVTDTPPTAEAGWRDFSGTMGLYRQSDSPGDLTRPFLCDADNTRPGQLTAWLQWPGASTVAVDLASDGTAPQTIVALANDPVAWGFVGRTAGGTPVLNYWRWNGTKFAQIFVNSNLSSTYSGTWGNSTRLPAATSVYSNGIVSPTIAVPTDGSVLLSASPGTTDVAHTSASWGGVTNAAHCFIYFDILFVVAISGGNLTVTPYRPRTGFGVGSVLNSVTYTGLAPALLTIPGEVVCLGVVPCEGAVYLVTDRNVYGIQWNDLMNTFLCTKLIELPRITSAPVVWNGEVYIGADNRIIHIVPGQRGYDWRTPDAMGNMPSPFTATIVQLIASPDALIAQVVDTSGSGLSAVLRMDSDGVWTCIHWSAVIPAAALVPVVDGTNPFGVARANIVGGLIPSMAVLPLPQAGRNPRTLAIAQRAQRPGPFRCITPWYDLESETAQKQLERFRTAVLMASTTYPIKVYYQTDYADEQGGDTFTTGCAKGTGTWHPCGYLGTNSTAYAGSTGGAGNGALWWEYDGTTAYPNSVGVLPRYPTYKRVRWCLEINGDSTGTTVPTLLSHAFHRLEYVTKAYERDIAIRLRVAELQGNSVTNGTVTYPTNASIKAARDALKALNSAKSICTYIDEWGDSHTVVITKYQVNITGLDGNGLPSEYVVNLSIMDVPLVGQN